MLEPLLSSDFNETNGVISPDGRWLAYQSDESGQDEVYVRAFTGPDSKWVVSTGGGTEPRRSRDGRELFYRNGDQMLVVDVREETDFDAGRPRLLFEGRFEREPQGNTNYDVTLDGERFLMVQAEEDLSEITVVLNWFEELKRLVPTDN